MVISAALKASVTEPARAKRVSPMSDAMPPLYPRPAGEVRKEGDPKSPVGSLIDADETYWGQPWCRAKALGHG